jgi:hypothetical protein
MFRRQLLGPHFAEHLKDGTAGLREGGVFRVQAFAFARFAFQFAFIVRLILALTAALIFLCLLPRFDANLPFNCAIAPSMRARLLANCCRSLFNTVNTLVNFIRLSGRLSGCLSLPAIFSPASS